MTEYRAAPEVKNIVRELIDEDHAVIERHGPRIEVLMTRPSKAGGKEQRFRIRKVSGVNAFLSTHPLPDKFDRFAGDISFVVLEISQWFWSVLTDKQARGLLDHLLHHLKFDYEKETWSIEGPEFGEFPGVLERHGDWRPEDSFKRFATRLHMQPSLLLELEEEDEPEPGGQEAFDVSMTHNGRTVHTNTEAMRRLAEGDFVSGPNGERVDAETGEVLEGAGTP